MLTCVALFLSALCFLRTVPLPPVAVDLAPLTIAASLSGLNGMVLRADCVGDVGVRECSVRACTVGCDKGV